MIRRRSTAIRLTILLFLLAFAHHCTRRLDTHVQGSGLLIAQVRVRMVSRSVNWDLGDLDYLLVEKEGSGEPPLRGTFNKAVDGVYVYNDVPPGRYRLYRGFVPVNYSPGANAGATLLFFNHPENAFVEYYPAPSHRSAITI